MAHIYVVVSSNSSMEVYPDNTLANFKVKLGRPIELHGPYEVGLVEIIYPNKSLNVQEKEATIHITSEKAENIIIPPWPLNKVGPKPKQKKGKLETNSTKVKLEDEAKTRQELQKWKEAKAAHDRKMREHKKLLKKLVGEEKAKMFFQMKKLPASYTRIIKSTRSLELTPGLYLNITRLVEVLRQGSEENELTEISIALDDATGMFSVKFLGDTKSVQLSPRMAELLGFPTTESGVTLWETSKAPMLPQLEGSAHSLYVYSSVVENQLVGHTVAPLLRVVCPTKSQMGDKVSEKYIRPYYIPVNTNYIDTIDIQIRTTNGHLFPFLSGDPVVLNLHFQPRKQ